MDFTLKMVFVTDGGKYVTINVPYAKNGVTLTAAAVNTCMDAILSNDIFIANSGKLASKKSATLIMTQKTGYDMA